MDPTRRGTASGEIDRMIRGVRSAPGRRRRVTALVTLVTVVTVGVAPDGEVVQGAGHPTRGGHLPGRRCT